MNLNLEPNETLEEKCARLEAENNMLTGKIASQTSSTSRDGEFSYLSGKLYRAQQEARIYKSITFQLRSVIDSLCELGTQEHD